VLFFSYTFSINDGQYIGFYQAVKKTVFWFFACYNFVCNSINADSGGEINDHSSHRLN
jgi:hypothetical protein